MPWLELFTKKADCPENSQNMKPTIVVSMMYAEKAAMGGSGCKSFVPKAMTTTEQNDNAGYLAAAVTARQNPSLRAANWACKVVP